VTLCREPPLGSNMANTDLTQPLYVIPEPKESASWTTSSTVFAAGAQATLSLRMVDPDTGLGYVVIEGLPEKCEVRGLAQCCTGPYVEPT
jgi:hypothetical protein